MDETRELIEQNRIVETLTDLFVGTDNRDWDLVKDCFAPRVLFDMSSVGAGPATYTTPHEIVAGWEAGLKPIKAIHHQTGNHRVSIRGEQAEAFCYGIAMHYLPNKTNANTRTFVGSYDFELAKQTDRWAITMMRFNLKFLDGNPNLERS